MHIKQLIDLEKVRTDNLKFRTYLENQVSNTVDECLHTVDKCLPSQIAQKIFKSKHGVQNRISVATDLAANFGCYQFRITPDIVSKLLRAAI